jgi:hypothetical protein
MEEPMGWFDNDRDYDRAAGYRGGRGQTGWGWGGGYDRGSADRGRWGTSYGRTGYGAEYRGGGYGGWNQPDTAFAGNRYGYDYTYRRRPEESPTYGRGGDQAVQRWAQRYGYDLEYEIQPNQGGGMDRGQGGMNRGQGGGMNRGQGGGMNRGAGGGMNRGAGGGMTRGYGERDSGYGAARGYTGQGGRSDWNRRW